MHNDVTTTNPQIVLQYDANVDALKQDPANESLFEELRDKLSTDNLIEPLAAICELHAAHQQNRGRAAEIWGQAALARFQLGQTKRGEHDLVKATSSDPNNTQAINKLVSFLMQQRQYSQAANCLETDLSKLATTTPVETRVERHRLLAKLWHEQLGRIDLAIRHWEQAWKLAPHSSEFAEQLRMIYASLGDEAKVAALYERQLEATADDDGNRRATLQFELGILHENHKRYLEASRWFEAALATNPAVESVREHLANCYLHLIESSDKESLKRATDFHLALSQDKAKQKDSDAAIRLLQKILDIDPEHVEAANLLERLLWSNQRWTDLDQLFQLRLARPQSDAEQKRLLEERAAILLDHVVDQEALREVLIALSEQETSPGTWTERLRALLYELQDWQTLVALLGRIVDATDDGSVPNPTLCEQLLTLASLIRQHLSNKDLAAGYLFRALCADPTNNKAFVGYAQHFRERKDWFGLADLLQFVVDGAIERQANPAEIVPKLEELAAICEQRLGDIERAINTWRGILSLESQNSKAAASVRRLESRAKMWASLVGELQNEADQASSDVERAEAYRRIARVYRERQIKPREAISLYEKVLGIIPDDADAIKSLIGLYEREGNSKDLARTLRRKLDAEAQSAIAELATEGKQASSPRDWSVQRRSQRLSILRRLAALYESTLNDVHGVVYACAGILELLPGDREALERTERVLEKAGDAVRLEQTLNYHLESATSGAERVKLLRRLAKLATDRDDGAEAMALWEQILTTNPNDAQAIRELSTLYEHYQLWDQLAATLKKRWFKMPIEANTSIQTQVDGLTCYARVLDEELGDHQSATHVWQKIVELQPNNQRALTKLAEIHQQNQQWRNLVEILSRQTQILTELDPAKTAQISLHHASILEQHLNARVEAIKVVEAVITHLEPENIQAHVALRRLYDSHGQFEPSVRIAERQLYLSNSTKDRIEIAMAIGVLCQEELGDPARALHAFERVLNWDPGHVDALRSAANLYAKLEHWDKYIDALCRSIDRQRDTITQQDTMIEIARTTAEQLGNPRQGFTWLRKAYELAPNPNTMTELRNAAEKYALWNELAEVYDADRKQLLNPQSSAASLCNYVAASKQLSVVLERHLHDQERAIQVLHDALVVSPNDQDLLADAERIASQANQPALWEILLSCCKCALEQANRDHRVALHLQCAEILNKHLHDSASATDELKKAFFWNPDSDSIRQYFYSLAAKTNQYQDVVAIESALLRRANTAAEKVAIQIRKAQTIETHLGDNVRAFRSYLLAF